MAYNDDRQLRMEQAYGPTEVSIKRVTLGTILSDLRLV